MAEDSKQEPKIKVTDKRMFTAEGELREDYRHLEDAPARDAPERSERTEPEPAPPAPEPTPPSDDRPGRAEPPADRHVEMPAASGAMGEPGFMDLIGLLAEPIAVYLGDAKLPDGTSAENLDAARFYIDLLEVVRSKTAGNLTPQESSVLEDLLYQLRMRYVRKHG